MKQPFDSKLRMSIDDRLINRLTEIRNRLIEATQHDTNFKSREVTVPLTDGYSLRFNALGYEKDGWSIKRILSEKGWDLKFTDDCWEVHHDGDHTRIETYGKMAADISREIEAVIDEIGVQVNLTEEPIYCPHCQHCGETGCCGFIGFLEKHVRNKTNCLYEKAILDDLEEFIRDHE